MSVTDWKFRDSYVVFRNSDAFKDAVRVAFIGGDGDMITYSLWRLTNGEYVTYNQEEWDDFQDAGPGLYGLGEILENSLRCFYFNDDFDAWPVTISFWDGATESEREMCRETINGMDGVVVDYLAGQRRCELYSESEYHYFHR